MPIYEYQCRACGNKHEAIQKMSAQALTICPVCNEPKLKKKISAAGFRLKGSGWYETDFKEDSKRKNVTESSSKEKSATKKTTSAKEKSAKTNTAKTS